MEQDLGVAMRTPPETAEAGVALTPVSRGLKLGGREVPFHPLGGTFQIPKSLMITDFVKMVNTMEVTFLAKVSGCSQPFCGVNTCVCN